MDPIVRVLLAWALFAGTHIGLAALPWRDGLTRRIGKQGFTTLYSLAAAATFAVLITTYAGAQTQGPAGLALGRTWLGVPLIALSVFGVVSMFAALMHYPASAYAISAAGQKPEPRGFERITRHGFAIGLSLVGLAHAGLAAYMTGTVFFAALAVFGFVGSAHQDTKLLAREPDTHASFMEKSSLVPFAAILSGRNRLVLSELRPVSFALGLLAAWGLHLAHPAIFDHGGVYVIATVLGGAALATRQDYRHARRRRERESREPMQNPRHPA